MAKQLKSKIKNVSKFGGTEKLNDVKIGRDPYDVSTIEAQSKTRLESDTGEGIPTIIRRFQFGINPQAWKECPPTKQQLFNYHLKGIEMALWRDGMKPHTDIEPRIVINAEKMFYQIFITAIVARGHIMPLGLNPQTLSQIAKS